MAARLRRRAAATGMPERLVVPEPGGARGPVRSSGETVATDVAA
ncbi:hypothetical protein [Nonomuraea sp. NPDC049141]